MKEITILSGKGGTGKTSITAAFASLAKNIVICDNDVDAADLHLILNPQILEEKVFYSAWIAEIDQKKCTQCGLCKNFCSFGAIQINTEGKFLINPFKCEGCKLCERTCPYLAIKSTLSSNNAWYVSSTRFGTMVHAQMGPGEENSGKLVSIIRAKAKEIAIEKKLSILLNDGPPGIGCTAISSITVTDMVIIVTEPSKSGLHDAKRIVELVESFSIPIFALINKYDINLNMSNETENYFRNKNITILGKIPFDKQLVEAMIKSKSIIEYAPKSAISKILIDAWHNVEQNLKN
ncbi:MAG: P-loop NTPase [Bacteroidales bacterium]|nr:P-loop NTPase [Bacteroidales bacterium]